MSLSSLLSLAVLRSGSSFGKYHFQDFASERCLSLTLSNPLACLFFGPLGRASLARRWVIVALFLFPNLKRPFSKELCGKSLFVTLSIGGPPLLLSPFKTFSLSSTSLSLHRCPGPFSGWPSPIDHKAQLYPPFCCTDSRKLLLFLSVPNVRPSVFSFPSQKCKKPFIMGALVSLTPVFLVSISPFFGCHS